MNELEALRRENAELRKQIGQLITELARLRSVAHRGGSAIVDEPEMVCSRQRAFALGLGLSTALLATTPAWGEPGQDASGNVPPPNSVFLELNADRPVELLEEVTETDPLDEGGGSRRRLVRVCTAPCDQWVPLDRTYRVSGEGTQKTRRFPLHGRAGDHVVVAVETQPTSALVGGIELGSVGLTVMTLGLMVFAAAANDEGGAGKPISPWVPIGASVGGVGAIGAVVGVVMIGHNARSSVSQSVAGAGERTILEPRGREVVAGRSPGAPAAFTIPVWSTSF